jgi:hypothetical protein
MKFSTSNRVTWSIALLAVGAFCPNLHADWGSLRGNNRAAPMQSAPRPQPQVNRAPQVNREPPVNRAQPVVRPQPPVRETQPIIRQPQPAARPELPRQEIPPVREQPPVVEHVPPPQVAVGRTRADETDRRRMDIDEDRRQSFFWSDYHKGMRIGTLPHGYHRIHVRNHDFFFFEGVFYDDEPSGYVVVAPPVDADIPDLPPGAETIEANGTVYYYAAGAFYVQQSDGSYIVVAPPMGVTVSLLPPDAVAVVINGTTYYQSDGTCYLPVMQDGVTAYLTVAQP